MFLTKQKSEYILLSYMQAASVNNFKVHLGIAMAKKQLIPMSLLKPFLHFCCLKSI